MIKSIEHMHIAPRTDCEQSLKDNQCFSTIMRFLKIVGMIPQIDVITSDTMRLVMTRAISEAIHNETLTYDQWIKATNLARLIIAYLSVGDNTARIEEYFRAIASKDQKSVSNAVCHGLAQILTL